MFRFVRERALGAVRRVIGASGVRALPFRYLGRPGSYYGYLRKFDRPPQERRRVVKLPYSEI